MRARVRQRVMAFSDVERVAPRRRGATCTTGAPRQDFEQPTSATPKAECLFAVSRDHQSKSQKRCPCAENRFAKQAFATGRPEGNTIVCVVARARTIACAVEECSSASASSAKPAVRAS